MTSEKRGSLDNSIVYKFLKDHFNISELQELCLDLSIDYESLPGQGKADKARELVLYAQRHGLIDRLATECRKRRPNVDWPSVSPAWALPINNEAHTIYARILKYSNDLRLYILSHWIAICASIIAVSLLLIFILIGFNFSQEDSFPCSFSSNNNQSGYIIVEDLQINPSHPTAGETVTVTFRIRNESNQAIPIARLIAGGRGPNAQALEWNAPSTDFPPVLDIILDPGEECAYSQTRRLLQAGEYFVEPVKMAPDGKWSGIRPFLRISFQVRDAQNTTKSTDK